MKKILMLRSNPFEPDERVYKEAKSLLKNGYDVTLLCWDRELKFPEKEVFERIKIERIGPKAGYGSLRELLFKMPLFWIKTFFRGLSKDFEVVHSYDYDTLPVGVWLKLLKRKKLIYDALELFYSYTADQSVNRGMFFIERINLPFIDGLIYTSQERLKIFMENTNLKERVIENTVIIHNYPELGLEPGITGVGPSKNVNEKIADDIRKAEYYEENKEQNVKRNKDENDAIKPGKVIFQYNGGIKEDRNLLNILKAFKHFKDEELSFLIIGNHYNEYGEVLKQYVKKNNLEEIIIFQDFIPIKDLLELLKKTHVGFVPLLKDNLNNLIPEPNKLYNYFATGNLAVVEDTAYLRKIVEDVGLGITCDFSNVSQIKETIEWILKNSKEANKMVERAYEKYNKEYNWESQEKKLIEFYQSLI